MIQKGLNVELRWFGLTIVGALIVGLALGHIFAVLAFALFCYVAWLLYNLARLEDWVISAKNKSIKPNYMTGIFGEVIEDVVLLTKRYRKDKKRLQAVVIRIQDMASAMTDGVVLLDNEGRIDWWNQAAQNLCHFQQIDHGHKITNIIRHPSFVKYFDKGAYDKPLNLKGARHTEQHIQFNIHPFGRGERMITLTDITRMTKLEHMRRDFVANVSHEMRTPLTVIKGYIETLNSSGDMPSPVWGKAMDAMENQTHRMTALVNDLITLSKLETADNESAQTTVAIAPLIQRIISDAQAIAEPEKHTFVFTGETDLNIRGNEKELHSAFSNLVFNAVKYSPDGCEVAVNVSLTDIDIIVSVSDTGPGIDSKHLPRLTERFYRVEDSRNSGTGGTGLGLAIVKHVLLRHDGQLKIRSKFSFGSTFSCQFSRQRLVERDTQHDSERFAPASESNVRPIRGSIKTS